MIVDWQRSAAEGAVCYVESGMVVGLGSGSTAAFAVRRIGQLLRTGRLKGIVGIPTSLAVEALARTQEIPLTTLEEHPHIDLTIDGADEVDPALNLIKGRGGAMLHERIVAAASARTIIVVDEGKLVPVLGTRAPVPVEVVPFGWLPAMRALEQLGARAERRMAEGIPVLTDEGNWIIDCRFTAIADPLDLAMAICTIPGVVAHGLFLGMASMVIVGGRDGLRVLRPPLPEQGDKGKTGHGC